jgi:DNA polymerase-1
LLTIRDSIAGEPIRFHFCESIEDVRKAYQWARKQRILALDTESSGVNCYRPNWRLRLFQFGDAYRAYVIPAKYRKAIYRILSIKDMFWIGHNGPHDIRSLDVHLGFETGVRCRGETFIPSHYKDPRNAREGGVNHGLKEQAEARIDGSAGKWEIALKAAFKRIEIPIIGEVYKSGARKGTQKYRKAKLSEGWDLIPINHPAYIAYAGADPILTYRLWQDSKQIVLTNRDLYSFDLRIQEIGDRLQRRAIRLDKDYTLRFRTALDRKASRYIARAKALGCNNIYSPPQLVSALLALNATLRERTEKGQYKTDNKVLRSIISAEPSSEAAKLARVVLIAKRVSKRREAYADAMLREVDAWGRVHPSIKTLAARTSRMSVSDPALQQLPTRESEVEK